MITTCGYRDARVENYKAIHKTMGETARDLDVRANVLRTWMSEAEGHPASALSGHGDM